MNAFADKLPGRGAPAGSPTVRFEALFAWSKAVNPLRRFSGCPEQRIDGREHSRTSHSSPSFGPANATGGVWECPDLFPLPLDGNEEQTKWILTVNLNPGGPNGGSGGQYFVGHFDGVAFTSETTVTDGSSQTAELDAYHWLDWGRDYYAAVSFNNAPDGRRLMVGWINNWQYGADIPTWPWRSSMSLVREMSLVTDQGQPRLSQRVADEYRTGNALSVNTWSDLALDEGMRHLHTGAPVEIIEVTTMSRNLRTESVYSPLVT